MARLDLSCHSFANLWVLIGHRIIGGETLQKHIFILYADSIQFQLLPIVRFVIDLTLNASHRIWQTDNTKQFICTNINFTYKTWLRDSSKQSKILTKPSLLSHIESKVSTVKLKFKLKNVSSDKPVVSSRPRKEQILPSVGMTLLLSMAGVIGFRLDSFHKNKEILYEPHFYARK